MKIFKTYNPYKLDNVTHKELYKKSVLFRNDLIKELNNPDAKNINFIKTFKKLMKKHMPHIKYKLKINNSGNINHGFHYRKGLSVFTFNKKSMTKSLHPFLGLSQKIEIVDEIVHEVFHADSVNRRLNDFIVYKLCDKFNKFDYQAISKKVEGHVRTTKSNAPLKEKYHEIAKFHGVDLEKLDRNQYSTLLLEIISRLKDEKHAYKTGIKAAVEVSKNHRNNHYFIDEFTPISSQKLTKRFNDGIRELQEMLFNRIIPKQ